MAGTVIITGIVLVLAVGGFVLVMSFRRPAGATSATLGVYTQTTGNAPVNTPQKAALDASPLLSKILDRLGVGRTLQIRLLQAGLLIKPSEMLALSLAMAALGYFTGLMMHKPTLGLLCAPAGFAIPFFYVQFRVGMRQKALVMQLGDALSMMASSLRSGYSFMRAMQVVRDEMDAPISEEFGRVLDELNLGVSQERALQHLEDRCNSNDVELVVTACQIQASVGGNLAQILDITSGMLRERTRLQGEIAALTAEGRLSAGILILLPPALGIIVSRMSPGYMDPLFQTHTGLMLLAGAGGAMVLGILVIRKLLAVQI